MGLNENPQGVASFHEIFGGPTPKSMGKNMWKFVALRSFLENRPPKDAFGLEKG